MTSMKTRKPEPAEIAYKNMRFLITDRPTDATMDRYIEVSSSVIPVVNYWDFQFYLEVPGKTSNHNTVNSL